MYQQSRSTKAGVCLASLMSIMLAACGGGGGGGGGSTGSVASTPVATPAPTPAPAPAPAQAGDTLVTSVPAYPFTDPDTQAAYNLINQVRGECHFGLLAYNALLEKAAQNHAAYISQNYAAHPEVYDHFENSAYAGYTGYAPPNRMIASGYGPTSDAEFLGPALSSLSLPKTDAVESLLTTVYHMKSMVDFGAIDVGLAGARLDANYTALVLEYASQNNVFQDISSTEISTYPCNGITLPALSKTPISPTFETPNPFPGRNYTTSPIGQPILVKVRFGNTLAITSFNVTGPSGAVTPAQIMTSTNDPNGQFTANEAEFIPNAPLAAASTYTVAVSGTNNGQAFNLNFSFKTP